MRLPQSKKHCPWPVDQSLIVDETPGRNPSRVFRALETALYRDDTTTVQDIVDRRPDVLAEVNQYGCTPLMFAQSKRAVEILLPFSKPHAADDDGGTAMGYMALSGSLDAIKALGELACPHQPDHHGVTPLMAAARDGHPGVVKHLAKSGDPMARALDGRTALMFAAQANCLESVKALIDLSDAQALDHAGMDALMYAARSSQFNFKEIPTNARVVELLAPRFSVEAASRVDSGGKSAFEHALLAAKNANGSRSAAWAIFDIMDLESQDPQGHTVVERVVKLIGPDDAEWLSVLEAKILRADSADSAKECPRLKSLRI